MSTHLEGSLYSHNMIILFTITEDLYHGSRNNVIAALSISRRGRAAAICEGTPSGRSERGVYIPEITSVEERWSKIETDGRYVAGSLGV